MHDKTHAKISYQSKLEHIMEATNKSEASKLLEAQICAWNHAFSLIKSMSLKCAVELGIPDIINNHGQPMPLSELISSLPIHPSNTTCVPRLMRLLVHHGLFSQIKVSKNNTQEEV